jgi:UDPglucose 6-dehydrogenase
LVGGFAGTTVAKLGLSFKKNTNDTRVSPALKVIPYLLDHGATVHAADPKAIGEIKPLLPTEVIYFDDPYTAATGSHVLILLVEWDDYTQLDLAKISATMQDPKYFFDTRNQYNKSAVVDAGLKYKGVGR